MEKDNERKPADGEKFQDQIQDSLKKLYDETLNEKLPDDLLKLLKDLEDRDSNK